MLSRLPIDDVLPALVTAIRERGVAVLVAPPGAGKTTRVPGALLDAGIVDGEIVVLQPRRLAARMAAARVASERGVALGGEVGYEVRFDRKVSGATKLRFVTEGVLTRRLLSDPELRGVGAVIIDEFHERHLDGDLALALVERLRVTRPALKLVVMSATLDAEPVAAFLGDAPVIRSEGRTFPVAIEYEEGVDDRHLGKRVASAVRKLAQEKLDGDVLVFLPGSGEIRRVAEDVADAASVHDLAVLPLHGDLTADEQDAAVRPGPRRKLILATNVAETSVTIDGVVAVIDSGLARIARHSPWTGLASLQVEPVSKASCIQRAGRAGRTRPGRVIRLYTKHDFELRRPYEVPEVQRTDLAGAALELYGASLAGLGAIRWYEAPPSVAVEQAETLLGRLGAIANGAITPLGRKMLRFAVHPRLGRLICEAETRGAPREACVIAAAVGARELRLERRGPAGQARVASSSDLLDDLDALERARADGMRADRLRREGLDVGTAFQVDKVAQQLARNVERNAEKKMSTDDVDRELLISILAAFPDRVGKRRTPRSPEIVFAGGGSGTLAPGSSVIDAELIVAVDVAEVGSRGALAKVQIRRASAIEASWLLDLFLDRIEERDELVWDAKRERVERVTQMTYDGLSIDENRDVDGARRAGRPAAELLARQAIAAGMEKFVDKDELAQWRARVALAAKLSGKTELIPDDEGLARVVANACDGAISFAELRNANLMSLLDAGLGEHRALVAKLAPTFIDLPRRRRVPISYAPDQPPWIASRMQDFFGLARAPSVGDGKVPLVIHLLAPNQRPVQVTADLPGFWVKHYPDLRRQLMRRYPRHQWPEDPTQLIKE